MMVSKLRVCKLQKKVDPQFIKGGLAVAVLNKVRITHPHELLTRIPMSVMRILPLVKGKRKFYPQVFSHKIPTSGHVTHACLWHRLLKWH